MNFRRRLCTAALIAALPLASQAQNNTLLFNSIYPPQNAFTKMIVKPWAEKIAQVTEGRVKVDVAPSSLAAPRKVSSDSVRAAPASSPSSLAACSRASMK